jgi:hypothetical protein
MKYFLIIVAFIAALILSTDISHSQSNEQSIAWCQQIAEGTAQSTSVPMRAGAIDSRSWPSYHPCKNLFFERECRQAVYAQAFQHCADSIRGRRL